MSEARRGQWLRQLERFGLVGVTGLGAAVGLAGSVIIGRVFGPDGRGDYAVSIVSMMAIGQILSWGLGEGLAIHTSQGRWPSSPRRVVLTTWASYTAVAAAVAAVLPSQALVAAGCVTCAVLLQSTSFALTMGHSRLWAAGQLAQPISVATVCAVSYAGVPVTIEVVTLAYVSAPLLIVLPALRVLRAEPDGHAVRVSAIFRAGTLRALSVNIAALVRRVDILVLGATVTAAEVGQYAVAVSLLDLCLMAPLVLAGLVLRDELRGHDGRLGRVIGLTVAWMVPPVVVLAAFGVWLVPAIWGPAFDDTYGYFLALVPGILAMGVARNVQAWRAGRSEQQLVVRTTMGWAPVAALTIAGGAVTGGVTGAALAVSLSYVVFVVALVVVRPSTSTT